MCKFMSTDTGIQRFREKHPNTGIQRFWDTFKLGHQGSGTFKDLGMYKDKNIQTQEQRGSWVPTQSCTDIRSHAKMPGHVKI